ncbi:hypothetical protein C8Q70DRAFT_180499 [Cubamyces menziesii]|nr:hypothetical protein C8Q70DRAFT_180499 [Cubamyces menziesii]
MMAIIGTSVFLSLAVFIGIGANAAATTTTGVASSADPVVAAGVAHIPPAVRLGDENGCFWDGTSPICLGMCPTGYHQVGPESPTGDGKHCFAGSKVFCCPNPA